MNAAISRDASAEILQSLQDQIDNFTEVKESPMKEVALVLDEDILSSEKFINFVAEQNSQQMFPLPTNLMLEHFKKCR